MSSHKAWEFTKSDFSNENESSEDKSLNEVWLKGKLVNTLLYQCQLRSFLLICPSVNLAAFSLERQESRRWSFGFFEFLQGIQSLKFLDKCSKSWDRP